MEFKQDTIFKYSILIADNTFKSYWNSNTLHLQNKADKILGAYFQ